VQEFTRSVEQFLNLVGHFEDAQLEPDEARDMETQMIGDWRQQRKSVVNDVLRGWDNGGVHSVAIWPEKNMGSDKAGSVTEVCKLSFLGVLFRSRNSAGVARL
jgi:hypothetical protein